MEYLRSYPHIRNRTPFNSVLLRLRSRIIAHLTGFFADHEFVQAHPPVISSSDAEGAGDVFTVSAEAARSRHPDKHGGGGEKETFFPSPKYLTVSSQLHLEALAQSVGKVWALAPTFRAERSDTSRHLSEFYMLEAEMSFVDSVDEIMDFLETMLADVARELFDSSLGRDLLLAKRNGEGREEVDLSPTAEQLQTRWLGLMQKKWPRISHAAAVRRLKDAVLNGEAVFEYPPRWTGHLHTEHEKFIANKIGNGRPVFVTHFPSHLKPFYMAVSGPQWWERRRSHLQDPVPEDSILEVPGQKEALVEEANREEALMEKASLEADQEDDPLNMVGPSGAASPTRVSPNGQRSNPTSSTSSPLYPPRRKRETVACFDLLVPDMCEIAGGSMREHRLGELLASMRRKGLIRGGHLPSMKLFLRLHLPLCLHRHCHHHHHPRRHCQNHHHPRYPRGRPELQQQPYHLQHPHHPLILGRHQPQPQCRNLHSKQEDQETRNTSMRGYDGTSISVDGDVFHMGGSESALIDCWHTSLASPTFVRFRPFLVGRVVVSAERLCILGGLLTQCCKNNIHVSSLFLTQSICLSIHPP